MRKSCFTCEFYDQEHAEAYGENICFKADREIILRRGQQHPRWCPIVIEQQAKEEYEKIVNEAYSEHY